LKELQIVLRDHVAGFCGKVELAELGELGRGRAGHGKDAEVWFAAVFPDARLKVIYVLGEGLGVRGGGKAALLDTRVDDCE
jgi:hypothetical protein